jgi:hypothetical protein
MDVNGIDIWVTPRQSSTVICQRSSKKIDATWSRTFGFFTARVTWLWNMFAANSSKCMICNSENSKPRSCNFSWPYDWFCHLRVVCLSADRLCSTDRWNFQGLIILGHSSWSVYAIFDPRISLSIDIHSAKDLKLHLCWAMFNGHFRNLNWRYLPYIRPI